MVSRGGLTVALAFATMRPSTLQSLREKAGDLLEPTMRVTLGPGRVLPLAFKTTGGLGRGGVGERRGVCTTFGGGPGKFGSIGV